MTTCAVPGRAHQAEAGLNLCRAHFDDLADWLHDVEREFAALDARPSLASNWGGSRGGRLASHTTPARINPLVHNDRRYVPLDDLTHPHGADATLSAFETLHSWANEIRSGRDIKPPGRWVTDRLPGRIGPYHDECGHSSCRAMTWRHFVPDRQTVATERVFLSRHLDWAATQPWIGEMWTAIRKLRGQLQAANGVGEMRVGICPECGAWLHLAKPRYTSGSQATSGSHWVVECDRDATHHWEGAQLMRLRLELGEPK